MILWVAGNMIYEGWVGGEHVLGLRNVSASARRACHGLPALITPAALTAFFQVLLIDLVLAGDNAIVVGALAAGLPAEQRRKVIMIGVLAALVLRSPSRWWSLSCCRSSA